MKQYVTYLFDADGTLLDTSELIFQSFYHTCRTHGGFEVDRETIFKDVGIPLKVQLIKLLGEMSPEELEAVIETHRSYQKTIYEMTLRLYGGVKEGLVKLKERGARLGIVTSRNRESLDTYLKHTGIDRLFEVVASPEDTANHKPHPEPVLWAMKQFGSEPDSTVFVGDAVFDILSGNAAGVDTALITWGHNDPEDIEAEPTWVIHDFNDLLS
ncbi:HAD family hydrolase [Spirochaeta isovalerica]|uniref:Pyrophosphatase PpaX n=1 Tax=Spirochaeta isovalerica TaxID=150 RepID=A0A841RJS5_9SPIO|nr:HAD family hydrolase [Spirochaeta isovalerica]MBB6482542.1 pyrophosphatase PpaX [Spirochaeta isovalerica]